MTELPVCLLVAYQLVLMLQPWRWGPSQTGL